MQDSERQPDNFDVGRLANEVARGYMPGMHDRIEALNSEQLGRAIVRTTSPSKPKTTYDMSGSGSTVTVTESHSGEEQDIVGYVLPCDPDQNEHIIVFKSGEIFVTQPKRTPISPEHGISEYKRRLSPGDLTIDGIGKSIPEVINYITSPSGTYYIDVKYHNTDVKDLEQISEAVDRAIAVASELKKKRDEVKRRSAEKFMQKVDLLFKTDDQQSE